MSDPDEPTGDLGSEAAHWSAFLDYYRTTIAGAVTALPVEEQRTSRVPSGWTALELLSHVLHMERRWFVWGFLGEQVADRGVTGPSTTRGSTTTRIPRCAGRWPTT